MAVNAFRRKKQDETESWFETKDERQVFMRRNLRQYVRVIAVAVGMSVSGGLALQAAGAPFFQDQDYSKNKRYQQGLREGKSDGAHNKDHSKKRHFNKDEDQKAYEAGYQKGHGH
jgi:hypothetical protein